MTPAYWASAQPRLSLQRMENRSQRNLSPERDSTRENDARKGAVAKIFVKKYFPRR